MDPKVEELLQSALDAQRKGNLKGAEEACLAILAIDDAQPGALQFLGLIAETRGNLTAAEDLMRRSLKANPAQPYVFNNLANQ